MKKKKVKMFVICTILAFGIIFTACNKEKVSAVKANNEDEPKLEYINTLDTEYSKDIIEYRDSETGVHYFVYPSGNSGGICPRYNADGTLYTD